MQVPTGETLKVLFICGGLHPGADGVGDYVRRLAAELICQGHLAGIIALNDAHTNLEINDYQQEGGLRIPKKKTSGLTPQYQNQKRKIR